MAAAASPPLLANGRAGKTGYYPVWSMVRVADEHAAGRARRARTAAREDRGAWEPRRIPGAAQSGDWPRQQVLDSGSRAGTIQASMTVFRIR